MCPLGWLGVASLCLGTLWAVPAQERRKAEKPKSDLTLYENLDLDNYDLTLDNYGEILDLSNYEELYDYGDLAPKVRGTQESPWVHPGTGIWCQGRMWHRRRSSLGTGSPGSSPSAGKGFARAKPLPALCARCEDSFIPPGEEGWGEGVSWRAWRAFQEGINNPNPVPVTPDRCQPPPEGDTSHPHTPAVFADRGWHLGSSPQGPQKPPRPG